MNRYFFTKRIFDFLFALIFIGVLLPVFILISIAIPLSSGLPVFYFQERVGKDFRIFRLCKFRTMKTGSEQKGLLTVGIDSRITSIGKFLRRYKLDELPQLFHVLAGKMSVVGPRPEVPKYVKLYSEEQRKILSVKPGLTDPASLEYFDESRLLAGYSDPEEGYIKEIMPKKLAANLKYIEERNLWMDMKIIGRTIGKIFSA